MSEEKIKKEALLYLIDNARTYNDGWVFTQEELIAEYEKSVEKLKAEPVKPVDNGITVLINKINERIRLIPDEPNLSQRGALDAYLNVISWSKDKAIENPTLSMPIQSGVEEAAKDFQKVTGFNSHEEMSAYENGRQDEESVICDWIKKWDGSTNSVLGEILKNKFIEWQAQQVKQPVMQSVSVKDRQPEEEGDYFVVKNNLLKEVMYHTGTKSSNSRWRENVKVWLEETTIQ